MANNVTSALDSLLTAGLSFYAPFADAGSGAVSLVASGAGASQAPTFTRATDATTVDENGLIVTVSAGTPRSYYDPTTLQYMGYLAEGARTNLLLRSQEFDDASWTKAQATVSANSTTAPDGTLTADTLTETATNATHNASQTVTIVSGANYAFSVYAKPNGRNWICLEGGGGAGGFSVWFDVQNGVVGQVSGAAAADCRIERAANGFYRCSVVDLTTTTSGSYRYFICDANGNQSYLGNGVSGIYIWGAQLEAGTFPSSYIPTEGSAVTRNADVLTYPFSGNADATVGTAYAEISSFFSLTPSAAHIVGFGGGSNSPLVVFSNRTPTVIGYLDGTNAVEKTGLSTYFNSSAKVASSWGGITAAVTGRGASPQSGAFDGDMGSVAIGIGNTGTTSLQWFGTIKNVRIWKNQFTAAQLSAITSG